MRYIVQKTGTQVKYGDDSDVFQFELWEGPSNVRTVEDAIVDLTGSVVTVDIANDSGFVGRFVTTTIPEKGIVNIDMSNEVITALSADTYYFQVEVDNGTKKKIFPTDGGDIIKIFKSLTEVQGELVPRTTIDDVLNRVDEKIAEYTSTIAKGDKGDKGDMDLSQITVGGRNYVKYSSGLNGSSTIRPTLIGATSAANVTVTYPSDGILMTNDDTNTTREWYYQVSSAWANFSDTPLTPGKQITFSADVMGTVPQAVLRYGFNGGTGGKEGSKNFDINNTSWTRVSITVTSTTTNTGLYFRIQGGKNNQYATGWSGGETLKFRYVKIEEGNVPTDWSPAPEDVDSRYVNKSGDAMTGTLQVGGKAGSGETGIVVTEKGSIELAAGTAFIDFHGRNSTQDYTSRIYDDTTFAGAKVTNANSGNGSSVLLNTLALNSNRSFNLDTLALTLDGIDYMFGSNDVNIAFSNRSQITAPTLPSDMTSFNIDRGIIRYRVGPNPFWVDMEMTNFWDGATWKRTKRDGVWQPWVKFSNDANVVHNTGTETIAGDKTFTGNIKFSGDVNAGDPWKVVATAHFEAPKITNTSANSIVYYQFGSMVLADFHRENIVFTADIDTTLSNGVDIVVDSGAIPPKDVNEWMAIPVATNKVGVGMDVQSTSATQIRTRAIDGTFTSGNYIKLGTVMYHTK